MTTCKYKQICIRHSNRALNCAYPEICQHKARYFNYDALFSQTSRNERTRLLDKFRVSGFPLEEEVRDMIDLGEMNRHTRQQNHTENGFGDDQLCPARKQANNPAETYKKESWHEGKVV